MKPEDLEEFVVPGLPPGYCLNLGDIIEYGVYMPKDYQSEVLKCFRLDMRVKRFLAAGDLTEANKLNVKCNTIISNLIKTIIN